MSHPPENAVLYDFRSSKSFRTIQYCADKVVRVDCSGSALVGKRVWKTRSGSTNNPKNPDGWRSPSPYMGEFITHYNGWAKWKHVWNGLYNTCRPGGKPSTREVEGTRSFGVASLPPWPNGLVSYMEDNLSTSAMNDLNNRKVNLAVSLAELQQTVDMLTDTVRAVKDVLDCVKRRRCGRLKKRWNASNAAELWLEYRYGWTPLVYDAYGLYEIARDYIRDDPKRKYVKGRAKMGISAQDYHTDDTSYVYGGAALNVPDPCKESTTLCGISTKSKYSGIYFAKYRIDAVLKDDIYSWYSNTGVDDPLLLAWELLPYSFVADWFANIGNFLDSINAYDGLHPLSACFTYGRQLKVTTDYIPGGATAKYIQDFEIMDDTYTEAFEFTRLVPPIPAIGTLRFQRSPLNTTRLFDAISLLHQAFRT